MGTCKKEIVGWGRIARAECLLRRPEREADITPANFYAARGLGRSYGDAALNAGHEVFLMERLNRFLEFNPSSGLLRAEAGVSIRDIVKTFVPRGFFMPVTPGTKEVTLGGCLAADVHGKNHHIDGTFSEHVNEFELVLPSGIKKRVQPREELFLATAGGMGLTGIITEMTLKLRPIHTPLMQTTHTACRSLEELLAHLADPGQKAPYSVAWVDLLSKDVRGIAISGRHADEGTRKVNLAPKPFSNPFPLPLNRHTLKFFNALYFSLRKKTPFLSSLESFFYPLDKIGNWNRLYGKRGFYQYQFVAPAEGVVKVIEQLKKNRCPVFLAVLKKFGKENANYLSFPKDGFTLAIDIPGNFPGLFSFTNALDETVLEYGGRVYLAKDLHLKSEAFRRMYPRYELFTKAKKKADPEGRLQTDLARRLEMV